MWQVEWVEESFEVGSRPTFVVSAQDFNVESLLPAQSIKRIFNTRANAHLQRPVETAAQTDRCCNEFDWRLYGNRDLMIWERRNLVLKVFRIKEDRIKCWYNDQR